MKGERRAADTEEELGDDGEGGVGGGGTED